MLNLQAVRTCIRRRTRLLRRRMRLLIHRPRPCVYLVRSGAPAREYTPVFVLRGVIDEGQRGLCARYLWLLRRARAMGMEDAILDLQHAEHVTGDGFIALLQLQRAWVRSGGRLAVYGPGSKLVSYRATVRLEQSFPCYSTLLGAVYYSDEAFSDAA